MGSVRRPVCPHSCGVGLSVRPSVRAAPAAPAAGGRSAEGADAAGDPCGSLRVRVGPCRIPAVPCQPYLSGRQRAGPLRQAGQRRPPLPQTPAGAGRRSPEPQHPLAGAAGAGQPRGRLRARPAPAPAPPPPREPRRISGALSGRQRRRLRAAGPQSASLIADRHRGSHHYHGHCLLFAALLFAFRSRLGRQVGGRQRGRR